MFFVKKQWDNNARGIIFLWLKLLDVVAILVIVKTVKLVVKLVVTTLELMVILVLVMIIIMMMLMAIEVQVWVLVVLVGTDGILETLQENNDTNWIKTTGKYLEEVNFSYQDRK